MGNNQTITFMEKYYSQNGEDFLINQIFENKSDGVCIEIGCLDGIEFSNTYFFEKKGWKGVCIEAHNDFIPMLRKNREHSIIVHCAVGEVDKENVTFYANKIGSLSTLDKNEEGRWKKDYNEHFHGFEEQVVNMRTLTSIFNELKLNTIDFVSLDIEGYEVMALKGLDFDKYRPRVFVIEYKDADHKIQLEEILFKYGYKYLATVGCNLFYSLNGSDKKVFNKNYGKIELTLIDNEGKISVSEIELLRPSVKSRIKNLFKSLRTKRK